MDKVNTQNLIPKIKKGATFVQYQPRRAMIFMVVNEVEEQMNTMTICSVTWYMLDAWGINIQRHFSMGAIDGEFSNFRPIGNKHFREFVALMRQCDAQMQIADSQETKTLLAQRYRRKIIARLKHDEYLLVH